MGSFRLHRFHGGLGVAISMNILLNISLVACMGKLTILTFLLRLVGRHFLKLNPRLRTLNTCRSNLRLLTGTSLNVFS